MHSSNVSAEKFFEVAYKIANLYGFQSAHTVFEQCADSQNQKNITTHKKVKGRDLNNISSLLKLFIKHPAYSANRPLLIFHSNIEKNTQLTGTKKQEQAHITLSVINIEEPYAEAILLSCANHIFTKMKSKKQTIRINSMGSREDSREYFKRLKKTTNKMKKHIQPKCKNLIDKSKMVEASILLYDNEHYRVAECIVPTLRLLSDGARMHFEKLIEYLEEHDLDYEFAPEIIEDTHHGIHTVFEIIPDNSPLRARGGRYDTLSYHVYRRKIPITSITITLPDKTNGDHVTRQRVKKPKIFFLHAGNKAQLRSLSVLSKLCDENICVEHCLHHSKICNQIDALKGSHSHSIIFGQEEAENNSVCLRKINTRKSNIIELQSIREIKKIMKE